MDSAIALHALMESQDFSADHANSFHKGLKRRTGRCCAEAQVIHEQTVCVKRSDRHFTSVEWMFLFIAVICGLRSRMVRLGRLSYGQRLKRPFKSIRLVTHKTIGPNALTDTNHRSVTVATELRETAVSPRVVTFTDAGRKSNGSPRRNVRQDQLITSSQFWHHSDYQNRSPLYSIGAAGTHFIVNDIKEQDKHQSTGWGRTNMGLKLLSSLMFCKLKCHKTTASRIICALFKMAIHFSSA
ncbi:hypothetical protein CLF_111878 [Clonorchis sinensis]|uniref:Uncharacterized protein n=1 Tax=Clonorchis sinensis TaxID=79923 RepID=G7YVH2_CLOSI|nr:hypothetical protein CLF_111878 [Clonorchis sinensis]